MHNRLVGWLIVLVKKITTPTPKLLLLPKHAHPSHLCEGQLSGTGQEPMRWVAFQVYFGSFFFNRYLAEINKAKYFLRGRGPQPLFWVLGLELPAVYLMYCLVQMLFDFGMYGHGSKSILLGVLLRAIQIGAALGIMYFAARKFVDDRSKINPWAVILSWGNLGLVTTATFSVFDASEKIFPLYGTCLPLIEDCKIGLGISVLCASLSVVAIWIATFFITRRLLEVYLGSVPQFSDHDCGALSYRSLKPDSVVVTAYESYVLPASDAALLGRRTSPIWLFDGESSELSRKGQNILFSIARFATTRFLDGHSAHHASEKKEAQEKNESRLWQFITRIHSGQLRAYVLIIAFIFCGISTQMSYTQSLKDFGHLSQWDVSESDRQLSSLSLSIDPVFKAKIKNNLPIAFASIAVFWLVVALWLRDRQINSFKRWDGQFVSLLPRVGYLWLLSFHREQSVALPKWELIEFAPESNRAIDEMSPETEKVVHVIEGIFLVLILEFLHIWH